MDQRDWGCGFYYAFDARHERPGRRSSVQSPYGSLGTWGWYGSMAYWCARVSLVRIVSSLLGFESPLLRYPFGFGSLDKF